MNPQATALSEQKLNNAISLFEIDQNRLQTAKNRQAAIWNNEPADFLPITFGTPVPEKQEFGLEFDMIQEFNNPDIMLYKNIWGMIGGARSGSDTVPSIRPNLGTAFVPTLFGLEETLLPDAMPWLKEHLTKEEIQNFQMPDDLSQAGDMPRAIECFKFYEEKLGPGWTFLADTQSPFDIAHLVRGDDIFTDMYDDSDFVHHLLRLCTTMYIEASRLMKQVSGEPLNGGNHSNCLWMANGGVRACEDCSTLLSPAGIDEFVMPYQQQALQAFGGGWVHYCGSNQRLLDALIDDAPFVRGINFGNPERYDFSELLPRLLDAGKCYAGTIDRKEDESEREYFERILAPLEGEKRGLILMADVDASTPEKCTALMELWHSLQS